MTIRRDRAVVLHADAMDEIPDPEVPERPKRPRSYSARYKAEILAEYERLDKAGKGALLRREGLYTSLISEWRKQRDRGAHPARPGVLSWRILRGRCRWPQICGDRHRLIPLSLVGVSALGRGETPSRAGERSAPRWPPGWRVPTP